MTPERTIQIDQYQQINTGFSDMGRFNGEKAERQAAKSAFLTGKEYNPIYHYGRLDGLKDDTDMIARKSSLYEASLELNAALTEPDADIPRLLLYRDSIDFTLKRMMITEAARNLKDAGTSAQFETARREFMVNNQEAYGAYNYETFQGMLLAEHELAQEFVPSNETASKVQSELLELITNQASNSERREPALISNEQLQAVHEVVMDRYKDIFEAVPDTDDSVYYDAEACMDIMNKALVVSGLGAKGWQVVIDEKKATPTTDKDKRKISLPSDIRRNAAELRRLIVHEEEVHARRYENGLETGEEIIAKGTAHYSDAEEGLGVFLECAVEGSLDNASFRRARDRYIVAGLALGEDGHYERDARQVHDVLWRMYALRNAQDGEVTSEGIEHAKMAAYTHVENAFRGTEFWMKGVIYTRLKVYYEGFAKNAEYFTHAEGGIENALERAMIGKIDHTNPEEVANVTTLLNKKDSALAS